MRFRQEQIVFVAGVAVLGLLAWGTLSGEEKGQRGTRVTGDEVVFEHFPSPNLAVALPDDTLTPPLTRELFSPPRDTRPLPPLDIVEPPRPPFAGLLPPTVPGPAPAVFGELLRRDVTRVSLPELFANVGVASSFDEDLDFFAASEEEEEETVFSLLEATRPEDDPFADETPEERTARLEGYKERYDWLLRSAGGLLFGRIENPDRFGLGTDPDRASEPIQFVEVDPVTGQDANLATGSPALDFHREIVIEFGFAGTPANELELRVRELGTAVTRGDFEDFMQFAAFCLPLRLEAPKALEIAERYYRLCGEFDPDDPVPRLGLARTFEAGFRFEDAFDVYRELLEAFPLDAQVRVGMARLEERFLMFEAAEARYRGAVEQDRTSWHAHLGLGRFLHRRGRHAEAIEHLEQATRLVPSTSDLLEVRVDVRVDLASAQLAAGRLADAKRVFEQAVRTDDTHQQALAGLLVTSLLSSGGGSTNTAVDPAPSLPEIDIEEGLGFELLLATGLERLLADDHEGARDQFLFALEADPLRADVAYDALAFLADVTGNDEEALDFIELALEVNPVDAYALYLRGRLLGHRDAYEGAREALLGALEIELDFEDALVALGDMAFRLGRFDDAERYLERAVGLEPDRAEVHSLRGLNSLRLGSVGAAQDSFLAALAQDPEDPIAKAGDAWCTYLFGDAGEANIRLADLMESRRNMPDAENDPYRLWANAQIERIREHVQKQEWTDVFNRKRLANGWTVEESDSPRVSMGDGVVEVRGAFDESRLTRVWREYQGSLFVSFEADVWIEPTNTRAGLFIARERQRRGESELTHEASVCRHKDGSTQVRIQRSGTTAENTDMEQPFPTGEWVRLRIEREGEGSDTTVTLSMNGIPLVEDVRLSGIGQGSTPLLIGLVVDGEVGREAAAKMDNVAVVYRVD